MTKDQICIGILAHVDAGKTTLSEALLFNSGMISETGRVDHGDAFLDTDQMEKDRGITIFSKQARIEAENLVITLVDTPGHVDFSAEMERTLQVLDLAVLVVSGADGVQGHTRTLWRLLNEYEIPVLLFVNKMDQPGTNSEAILADLEKSFGDGFVDLTEDFREHSKEITFSEETYELMSMASEEAMEAFLKQGSLENSIICEMFEERQLFPVLFGSALKNEGVDSLLRAIPFFAEERMRENRECAKEADFSARVYKIARDEQKNRLTYIKVTGGKLKARQPVSYQNKDGELREEKVNQLRFYSGLSYTQVDEVEAGMIVAVTGLSETVPGQGLGAEDEVALPILEPVLTYRMVFKEEVSIPAILPQLRELEEENPELHIFWEEETAQLNVQIMGDVQIEILKKQLFERFGLIVEFLEGTIVYKETLAAPIEGVGHFEPLRHYAEVHLLLEPSEPGSGMTFSTNCSEEVLAKNWQRLILTHLMEKEHRGVLTGAALTDVHISVIAGRSHLKHTEGGDFRQATYRAVRHGLRRGQSILLEPYYRFSMEMPMDQLGRAMTDVEAMFGTCQAPEIVDEKAFLTGIAPVSTFQGYPKDFHAYTSGEGKISCQVSGYFPCHNSEEVMEEKNYNPEADLANPTGSVFCAHGAGFVVNWDEVENYMHLPFSADMSEEEQAEGFSPKEFERRERSRDVDRELAMGLEEIQSIIMQAGGANRGKEKKKSGIPARRKSRRGKAPKVVTETYQASSKPQKVLDKYLLVDGYNIIFAWKDLAALAKENMDSAKGKLLDILCNYQGMKQMSLICVFDAYRVKGHKTEIFDYHNIHVVYTKEAQTADSYIEQFATEHKKEYDITVATSDGLEQIIIRGAGAKLFSAHEFEEEVKRVEEEIRAKLS